MNCHLRRSAISFIYYYFFKLKIDSILIKKRIISEICAPPLAIIQPVKDVCDEVTKVF